MRLSSGFWGLICIAILALAWGHAQAAEKRVALIIGNSAYKHVSKLPNPANDSAAIAALLKRSGFDVVESRQNLSINEMRRAVRDFTDKTREADIGVVFYAGHGIELDGTNYLIPVDAALERDIDVEDEAVSLDRVIRVLEPVKRLRLVILDACRDNPFTRSMKRTIASRSIGRGLAKVDVVASDTLIAFAAKAGSTAADGDGKNSPFTIALLSNLATPGLDLRLALGRVRDHVLRSTSNKQEPFVYGSLGGSTVALVPAAAQQVAPTSVRAPSRSSDAEEAVRRDYELAAQIGTKEVWDRFLQRYPSGFYADLARAARHKLEAKEAKATPAKEPAPEPAARSGSRAKPERAATARTGNRAATGATPSQSGGRVVCDKGGCQEIKPGCRATESGLAVSIGVARSSVVCN